MRKLILILFFHVGAATVAGTPPSASAPADSFTWCLHTGLERFGVTTSYDTVRAYLGTAFSPAMVTGRLCLSSAFRAGTAAFPHNAFRGLGLHAERLPVGPAAWSRAVVRRYMRTRIRESLAATNLVLLQGGWELPAGCLDWGIVQSVDSDGAVVGTTPGGIANQRFAPASLLVLSVTNVSCAPRAQERRVLDDAARRLRSETGSAACPGGVLTGVAAIDYLADCAHRRPFCLACGKASAVCVTKLMRKLHGDMNSGVCYLNAIAPDYPAKKRQALLAAASEISAVRDEIAPYTNLARVRREFANGETQAAFGEKVRGLNKRFVRAAEMLAIVCDARRVGDTPSTMEGGARVSERKTMKLVGSLPLFRDLDDGGRTFLCSALLAAQAVGVEELPEWLKGSCGVAFRFLIETNAFSVPDGITQGFDCGEALIQAIGFTPVYYSCNMAAPTSVRDMVRREMVASLDAGLPLIVSESATTGRWGLVVGYDDFGRDFICRMPSDTNAPLRVIQEVPRRVIALGERRPALDTKTQVRGVLRRLVALSEKTNLASYASGRAAIDFWIERCKPYARRALLPTHHFARQNEALWLALRDSRRDTYRYLDAVMRRMPKLAAPLDQARTIYVKQVNMLNHALADGLVLGVKDGVALPMGWSPGKCKKQIDVLKRLNKMDEAALSHVRFALEQLSGREHEYGYADGV